jgi:putative ABC transport system substrate-binding protein
VAILYGPDPRIVPTLNEIRVATRAVGIQVRSLEVRGPEDFERALDQILRERADGLVTTPSAVIAAHILRLGDLVLKRRLPWITTGRSIIAAGALMAYGADIVDMSRHAAIFVDKILKGARPADLPVEQPTKFELFVNLKTAKALGLTIPPAVLARADEVIQ